MATTRDGFRKCSTHPTHQIIGAHVDIGPKWMKDGFDKSQRMVRDFTKTEHEVIVLKAIWELIAEMVNYEIFLKPESTDAVTSVMFRTRVHQRLFNILLVDFLSQPSRWPFGLSMPPRAALKSDKCILFHLRRICDDPQFSPAGKHFWLFAFFSGWIWALFIALASSPSGFSA
jgi:hypothetical protein